MYWIEYIYPDGPPPCPWPMRCLGLPDPLSPAHYAYYQSYLLFAPYLRENMDTCHRPFPPGSFDEHGLGLPPAGATEIAFSISPTYDWDLVLCAYTGPRPSDLRRDPRDRETRWRPVAFASSGRGEPCRNSPDPKLRLGCEDSAVVTVVGNTPYKLVAYNVADYPHSWGRYEWR